MYMFNLDFLKKYKYNITYKTNYILHFSFVFAYKIIFFQSTCYIQPKIKKKKKKLIIIYSKTKYLCYK